MIAHPDEKGSSALGEGGIGAGAGGIGASQGSGGSNGGASFEELYNESFGRLYDFSIRMLRDREEAALAVQASYLTVYQELQAGEQYASFPAQLFSAAHRDISERLRRIRGSLPEGQDAFNVPDPEWAGDPLVSGNADELAHTAWEVASTARPDELELLELKLRQGLAEEEIAAALRTRPETVRTRVDRVQQGLEESFTGLLLLQRGRQTCVDLDFLVGDDSWSMPVRRRVLRHYQTCQSCQRTRNAYPPAANVYAALAPVAAPRGWQEAMLARLVELAGGAFAAVALAPVAAAPPPRPVPPPPPSRPEPGTLEPAASYGGGGGLGDWIGSVFASGDARGPLLAMLLGALLVLVVVLGALCGAGAFSGDGDDGPGATTTPTAGSPTPTTTGSVTPSPTPSETPTIAPFPTNTPPAATQPPPPPQPTARPTNTPVFLPTPTRVPPTNTSPPQITPPPGP